MRLLSIALSLGIGAAVCGCSGISTASSKPVAAYSVDAKSKAEAALKLLMMPGSSRYRLILQEDTTPGAFGWPDGRIAVTTGLVAMLNEQELAAAIAHEMGHMAADPGSSMYGLDGCKKDLKGEFLADEVGCRILEKAGIGREAMVSMLRKLQGAPGIGAGCRVQIGQRVMRISAGE